MAIDPLPEAFRRGQIISRRPMVLSGLVLVVACSAMCGGCGRPAQIGSSDEVHKNVDALFTALTAKDPRLLDQCEQKLAELHTSGKLPDAAHKTLTGIIGEARSGGWEPAAARLYKFIDGQRTGPAS